MTAKHGRRRFHRALAGVLIGLLATVAACSSSAPAGTGAASTAAVAGTTSSAAPAGVAAGSSPAASCGNPIGAQVGAAGGSLAPVVGAALCGMADLDPCTMLKQADVQALFSVPLATSTTDHTGDCTWKLTDPDKGDGLDVVVNVGQGETSLNQDMGLSDLTPIAGIGDKANWALLGGYFPHLGAVQGSATCELTIAGGNGQLSVHTTGQSVFAKIDDAAVPGFMRQFGELCNQIFSGLRAQGLATGGAGAAAWTPSHRIAEPDRRPWTIS